ncbi:hypothetical protein EJ02DRAFT_417918 [Clathrospora elynae]|uniref:chitinase n=1 Tax=Clathrospora elynae TaxID=706981 RepID=A0A6A5T9B9_9PLEO|nr:hypothetical protein EJ02DRAFT_417918 [Clathrospora elynae]
MPPSTITRTAIAVGLLASSVSARFDVNSKTNIAMYWGQGDAQITLSEVCANPNIDIVNIGFVNGFPQKRGDYPKTNHANACWGYYPDPNDSSKDSGLLEHCEDTGLAITACQAAGKKVLLSLGGGAPTDYYLPSPDVASYFADFLIGAYGPVTNAWAGMPRPFGDAVVDGFDFDLEADEANVPSKDMIFKNYDVLAARIKFKGPNMLLSAAPQCICPDARAAVALSKVPFDFVFTQFYNTWDCSAAKEVQDIKSKAPSTFTFNKWVDWLQKNSPNKNIKLYLGLPAGPDGLSAHKDHYLKPEDANTLVTKYRGNSMFGGVMLWEATVSKNNNGTFGQPYDAWMKYAVSGTFANNYHPVVSSSSTLVSSTKVSSSLIPSSTPISSTKTPSSTPISSTKTPSSTPISSTKTPSSTPILSTKTSSSIPISSTKTPSSTPVSSSKISSSVYVTSSAKSSSTYQVPSSSSIVTSSSGYQVSSSASSSVYISPSAQPSSSASQASSSVSSSASAQVSSSTYSVDVSSSASSTVASRSTYVMSSSSVNVSSSVASSSTYVVSSSSVNVSSSVASSSTYVVSSNVLSSSYSGATPSAASSTPCSTSSNVYPSSVSSSGVYPSVASSYSLSVYESSSSVISSIYSEKTPEAASSTPYPSSKGYPTQKSSIAYPAYPVESLSVAYPVYPAGSSEGHSESPSTGVYPSVTKKPEYPEYSAAPVGTSTVVTTTYVDVCPTGLTTITTTYTKTVCTACAKPTKEAEYPEGWTTSVYVDKTVTVTITRPVHPATDVPTYPSSVPEVYPADYPSSPLSSGKPAYPAVPEASKAPSYPEVPEYPAIPAQSSSAAHQYPTVPVASEYPKKPVGQTTSTLSKVPVPAYTPAPYPSSVGGGASYVPAGSASAYVPKPSGTGAPTKPSSSAPSEFEGAANQAGVRLVMMLIGIAGAVLVFHLPSLRPPNHLTLTLRIAWAHRSNGSASSSSASSVPNCIFSSQLTRIPLQAHRLALPSSPAPLPTAGCSPSPSPAGASFAVEGNYARVRARSFALTSRDPPELANILSFFEPASRDHDRHAPDPFPEYRTSLQLRQEQADVFYRAQHNRSRASSSTGSVANSLRRTPNFERARSVDPGQQERLIHFQTPRSHASSHSEPHPALRISRRTASAIRFVLEEGIRLPHPFTPDLVEENALMSDLMGGRASNGGARSTSGPVPVTQADRSNIRTPTQIMNARRQRAEVEEQRKAEEEQRRISAERRAQAVSGVAGAPTEPGSQRQPQSAPLRSGDQYVQYPTSSGGVPRQPERVLPSQNIMFEAQDASAGASQGRPRAAPQSQQQTRLAQANLSVPTAAEQARRPPGAGHARRPSGTASSSQAGPSTAAPPRPPPLPGSSTAQPRESTTSNFPHAFERWETLSSHWEGLTSYWIRRLEQNTDEVRREPLAQQMSRQITDLSAAGANLFHAVVELQRLRASSERKFQRWVYEHRQDQERAQDRETELGEQIAVESKARAEAEANVERMATEKKNAERAVTEMKRELQISKEEARRAWEELGRREQEERDRTSSLREGQPTLVGGVQVVPMVQDIGPQARLQGEDSYAGAQSSGSGIEQHYSYEDGQSPTDTDPFTENAHQREPEMPSRVAQGTYVPSGAAPIPSSRSGASSSAVEPSLAPAPLQYPYYSSQAQQAATRPVMSPPEAFYQQPRSYLHQESESGIPEDEQSYVTSHGEEASEGDIEYALDERGNFIRDDSGRRIPFRSLQSPVSDEYDVEDARRRELEHLQHYGTAAATQGSYATSSSAGPSPGQGYTTTGGQPDYSGDGYGDEWVGMRHHHPTRLSDVPEEDERSRASPIGKLIIRKSFFPNPKGPRNSEPYRPSPPTVQKAFSPSLYKDLKCCYIWMVWSDAYLEELGNVMLDVDMERAEEREKFADAMNADASNLTAVKKESDEKTLEATEKLAELKKREKELKAAEKNRPQLAFEEWEKDYCEPSNRLANLTREIKTEQDANRRKDDE